jgi:hypothetical protein
MGLFSRDARQTVAVVDVASGSIGGALFSIADKTPPAFLASVRVPLRTKGDRMLALVRGLDEVAYALMHHGPERHRLFGTGALDAAYVSIGAPWRQTRMRMEHREAKHPFLVSRQMLGEVLKQKPYPDIVTSTRLISSTLNGYRVKNPIGKTVSHAEFWLLESSVKKEVREAVARFAKRLAPKAVSLESATGVPYALKRLYPRQLDSLILTVSEEETTYVLMREGAPQSVGSIPLGIASFQRAAHARGTPLPSASSLIDTGRNKILEEAMQKVEQVWLATLVNKLRETAAIAGLPPTVFLLAEPEPRNFLKRVLEKQTFSDLWMASEPPQIIPMLPSHFAKRLSFEPSSELDVLLACLALSLPRGKR